MYYFAVILVVIQSIRIANSFITQSQLRSITKVSVATPDGIDNDVEAAIMKQLILHFDCDELDSEEISELLFEVGVSSVSVEVESEKENVLNDEELWADLGKQRSWKTACLRATVPASFDIKALSQLISDTYPTIIQSNSFDIENIDGNLDWVSKVQADWKPQVVDDLTIRFPWHHTSQVETPHQLVLEGGAAFGTGDHPTTRLCLRWLKSNTQSTSRVLDYGTGSAVLGLAAKLYGAERAAGTDIDKDALISALHNCWNNNLEVELYRVVDGDENEARITSNLFKGADELDGMEVDFPTVDELKGEKWDLVVANILAPILIRLSDEIYETTITGGKFALSGIVAEQASSVVECYSKLFQNVKVEANEDNWVLITGEKQ